MSIEHSWDWKVLTLICRSVKARFWAISIRRRRVKYLERDLIFVRESVKHRWLTSCNEILFLTPMFDDVYMSVECVCVRSWILWRERERRENWLSRRRKRFPLIISPIDKQDGKEVNQWNRSYICQVFMFPAYGVHKSSFVSSLSSWLTFSACTYVSVSYLVASMDEHNTTLDSSLPWRNLTADDEDEVEALLLRKASRCQTKLPARTKRSVQVVSMMKHHWMVGEDSRSPMDVAGDEFVVKAELAMVVVVVVAAGAVDGGGDGGERLNSRSMRQLPHASS